MKIRFNSGDNLPIKQEIQMHNVVMIIRFVFYDKKKYYPQVYQMSVYINQLNRYYHGNLYKFNEFM